MRPIGIDLFAGAGGLSLGFEWAGLDIVAAVEIDPIHSAIHEYNFPYSKTICADVKNVTGKFIRDAADISEDVDVLFGGAPCQGFSLIGKRALDDDRNALVFHFVRLVKEIKPKYFVFENVKGLTVGKHKQFLNELIEQLSKAGYQITLPYKVLNAAEFGVPQDRKRLFLIGARKDQSMATYPEPTERVRVADAIDDLPEAENFEELWKRDWVEAKYGQMSNYALDLHEITSRSFHFGYQRNFPRNLLTSSLRTEHTDKSRSRFKETTWGTTEPISRFYKLDPDGVSNTLRAGTASDRGAFTSPRPIHPYTPRCITVREAARLHSYPDWFRFHATKWHGFRQIGNSVPPKLGMAVGSQIVKALGVHRNRPSKMLPLGNQLMLSYKMGQAADYFGVSPDVIPKRKRKAA